MIIIENIGTEVNQIIDVPLLEGDATISLTYLPMSQDWYLSVEYLGKKISGVRLSCGVLHMRAANFPFDFTVEDLTGNGTDPFLATDFEDERCQLIMLDAIEMEVIRGVKVG